ncbi:ABC transporter ATP-binding protein [Treponema primitia]|uniref:ABC transporter ATP-binding protein n=1 Tax=Treponema primitia TaxID=88058 RepID=UPI00397F18E1
MDNTIIRVEDASVRFNMASEKIDSIKEYFIKLAKRQLMFQEFLALQHITFEVKKGESWGIVGSNGAGKSTLLKLICGVLTPDKGSVMVNGSIAPMIELGAGFDPDLTAEENIYLEGALLGYDKKFMKNHYNRIVAFAELADFMKMPIKNYSSGMQARMAFAIATLVMPDILIVDEVLSVGDAAFQRKCEARIHEMLEGKTTLLFVSHSNDVVKRLCEKAVWLRKGEIAMIGSAEEVCDAYAQYYQ